MIQTSVASLRWLSPSARNDYRHQIGIVIGFVGIGIQLAISNSSPSMAFVLHNAFIDFSKVGNEPSAGLFGLFGGEPALSQGRNGSATSRISSVESRVARGQLLDAQQTTGRNITMRVLTTLGSIAAGYSFSFGEKGIAKGIAAFNGNVVPGVAYAWPDLTVAQINRISDFGYQTNKLIPKEGGEIVVCFFPIADFLTPGFQQIFKKAPAALFTPPPDDQGQINQVARLQEFETRNSGR